MGCGESKHAVATTESLKKSASRSNSKRVEDPTTTTIAATTNDSTNETKKDLTQLMDGNKNGGETVGVIPGKPFKYEKQAMEATNGAKKKSVVVVGHDRTTSKESQVSDYFTDAFEEKSEYESPLPNQEKAVNEAVVVVQELVQSAKQGKIEDGTKQVHVRAEEGSSQRQDNQAVVAKQDAQEIKPTKVEPGTAVAAKDREEQASAAKQENKIMEIVESEPNKLVVRTKIQDNDA